MKNEKGYTVVEVLTAMVIASLIIGFCFSTYLFVQRSYTRWYLKTEQRNFVNSISQIIAKDVSQSVHIEFVDTWNVSLNQTNGKMVRYNIHSDSLLRNEVSLKGSRSDVITVNIIPINELVLISAKMSINMEEYKSEIVVETLSSSKKYFHKKAANEQ